MSKLTVDGAVFAARCKSATKLIETRRTLLLSVCAGDIGYGGVAAIQLLGAGGEGSQK